MRERLEESIGKKVEVCLKGSNERAVGLVVGIEKETVSTEPSYTLKLDKAMERSDRIEPFGSAIIDCNEISCVFFL